MIDTWPSPNCTAFTLDIVEWTPPPPQDPITSFPYMEDFESCGWPTTIQPFAGAETHAVVTTTAGKDGGCGAMLDGNGFSGFYHSTNCDLAFTNNKPVHNAGINMTVEPTGGAGVMTFWFDYNLFYSFSDYYSGLRVSVNDTYIQD